MIGSVVLGVIVLRPAAPESPLAWWILNSALTPERILPMAGLGVALGLVSAPAFAAALLLFLLGLYVGFLAQNPLLAMLIGVPHAAMHHFFTGPIASIAVGLALIAGTRLRPFALLPIALAAGAVQALAIVVTDPSLHDPTNSITGVLIALWIVAAVSLTARAFRRAWFHTGARILGSWLIAIGLLYGGAALLPRRETPLPQQPAPLPEQGGPHPDIERQGSDPGPVPGSPGEVRQP